ncbi:MAG TPA: hypothetical protein VIO38_15860 [Rariglobus sp.]
MSLLGYLMQKVGFSSHGAETCQMEAQPFFTSSELDSIGQELRANNAAARAVAEKHGLGMNKRIAAANLH